MKKYLLLSLLITLSLATGAHAVKQKAVELFGVDLSQYKNSLIICAPVDDYTPAGAGVLPAPELFDKT